MNSLTLGLALFSLLLAAVATRVALRRGAMGAPLIGAWVVALAHPGFWRPGEETPALFFTLLSMVLVAWAHTRKPRPGAGAADAREQGGG